MLARLHVAVPFQIALPEGEKYTIYSYEEDGYRISYEEDGYRITIRTPGPTDVPLSGMVPTKLTMNDSPATLVNGLHVDFRKESFNRRKDANEFDPPKTLLLSSINEFLLQLRYVTRGFQIQLLESIDSIPWSLEYLEDDETQLEKDAALYRKLYGKRFGLSVVGVNREIWESVFTMDPDFDPPDWDSLRLDALSALPHVGSAIVLSYASLEVFIAEILNSLAARSALPDSLWEWINDRGDYSKEPSTAEQFDVLLRELTGHSLKEEDRLWEAFQNLRKARNNFVHQGVPAIGNNSLESKEALDLIRKASSIIHWVRQFLPADLCWPEFEPSVRFTAEFTLLEPTPRDGPDETKAPSQSD